MRRIVREAARTTRPRGRAGWRSRSTRRRTRRSSAASPRRWRSCSTRRGRCRRSRGAAPGRRGRRGEPDAASARGAHPGPPGGPARRGGAGHGRRLRAVQRRAPGGDRGVRGGLPDRPARLGWRSCRTPASCSAPRPWRRRSTPSRRSGWGTGCARWRTRGCSTGWWRRGWRWRCARCRTWLARRLRLGRGRAAADAGRGGRAGGAGGRRPADLRLAAGRPVRDVPGWTTASPTTSSPTWRATSLAASRAPSDVRAAAERDIAGLAGSRGRWAGRLSTRRASRAEPGHTQRQESALPRAIGCSPQRANLDLRARGEHAGLCARRWRMRACVVRASKLATGRCD